MICKGLEQRHPVNDLVDRTGINDDRFIFKKSTGVSHAFFKSCNQCFGISVLKHHSNRIERGAFKIEG